MVSEEEAEILYELEKLVNGIDTNDVNADFVLPTSDKAEVLWIS